MSYELLGCGWHGHALVGTDAAAVRQEDDLVVREQAGLRWHRCLRCDAWLPRPAPASPARPFPPEHAEITLPLRGRELRERAQQANVARTASRKHRAVRRGASRPYQGDDFTCPAIPDYVDGSFLTFSPAGDQAAGQPGRMPAARRAA